MCGLLCGVCLSRLHTRCCGLLLSRIHCSFLQLCDTFLELAVDRSRVTRELILELELFPLPLKLSLQPIHRFNALLLESRYPLQVLHCAILAARTTSGGHETTCCSIRLSFRGPRLLAREYAIIPLARELLLKLAW